MTEDTAGGFHFSLRPNRAHEINWMDWGPEAFARSKKENKPVLLSISAVWCHWCHVMDETSYSDGQVISIINENFIPVRVDSDRRPDINSRYNQGGWPTTAVLTHEGEVIAGTTFIREDHFCRLLNDVFDLYRNQAAELDAAVQMVRMRRAEQPPPSKIDADRSVVDLISDLAAEAFDTENGGFGTEPKFPYVSVMCLLVSRLAADAPGRAGEILRVTLERMAAGGVYDQVEGGFFRYATKEDWSEPHYEKLLEDNAGLLGVYCDAYNLSNQADYAKTAYSIFHYMSETLRDRDAGTFAGSQDADEEYYSLTQEERDRRSAPFVDRTILLGANALAASSLLRAFQVLGDEEFRDQALAALDFLWNEMWREEDGPYHYHDGAPHNPGLLLDAARLASASLDAYESGGGGAWLSRSIKIADWMLDKLVDPESGALFDTAYAPGEEGFPAERTRPLVENSIAAAAFVRLGQNTGQSRFTESARRVLKHFSSSFHEYGLFAADYALAVSRLVEPPVRVTISGPPQESATLQLIRAAHRARVPFRSVEVIDPEEYGEDLEESGYGYAGIPTAYVCVGSSCQPPVTDPLELPGRLENSWPAIGGA